MEEFMRWLPLLLVVGIGAAIYFTTKRDRSAVGPSSVEPAGIAGWLLFPAILVILVPLAAGANALVYLTLLSEVAGTELLVVVASIGVNVTFAIAGFILAMRFFQYKRDVPNYFFNLTVAAFIYFLVDYFVVANVFGTPVDANEASGPLVGVPGFSMIWAIYMKMSVRVRNTFTR